MSTVGSRRGARDPRHRGGRVPCTRPRDASPRRVSACRDPRIDPGRQLVVHAARALRLARGLRLPVPPRPLHSCCDAHGRSLLALVVGGAVVLSGRRTPVFTIIVRASRSAPCTRRFARHVSWRAWAAIGAGVLIVAVVSIPGHGALLHTDAHGLLSGGLRRSWRCSTRTRKFEADHACFNRGWRCMPGRWPSRVDEVPAGRRHRPLSEAT